MKYFSPKFISFLKKLASNNNRDWFLENKKLYETEVKFPFIKFIDDLILKIKKTDPSVKITSSEAIMRINRDIRFAKDKSPYKIHVSAILSKYGKKSKEYPGLYIQLGPENISIYSGAHEPEKENLLKIRKFIVKNLNDFNKVISNPTFKKKFGAVKGDKNKIIPAEFKNLIAKQPLLANKGFYIYAKLPVKEITSEKLIQTVLDYYKTAHEFNQFFIKAMNK